MMIDHPLLDHQSLVALVRSVLLHEFALGHGPDTPLGLLFPKVQKRSGAGVSAILRKALLKAQLPAFDAAGSDIIRENVAAVLASATDAMGKKALVPQDTFTVLVDAIAMRHQFVTRGPVWQIIGVTPDHGRVTVAREGYQVPFPLFFTVLSAAFFGVPGRQGGSI